MIAAMNYFTLVCMKEDKEGLLDRLQSSGLVMLVQSPQAQPGASPTGEQVQRMERLMQQIKPYAPKRGMLSGLPEESVQALKQVAPEDVQAVQTMEQLLDTLDQCLRRKEELLQKAAALAPWKELDLTEKQIKEGLGYTTFRLGVLPAGQWEALSSQEGPLGYTQISRQGNRCYLLAAAVDPADFSSLPDGWEPAAVPSYSGIPAKHLEQLVQETERISAQLEQLQHTLTSLAADEVLPARLTEQYRAVSQRESAPCVSTREAVLLEGWVPQKKRKPNFTTSRMCSAPCRSYTNKTPQGTFCYMHSLYCVVLISSAKARRFRNSI